MDAAEKHRRALGFDWYHTVDLGDGVVTRGQYDHRPLLPHYGLPDDLTGRTVLDVGPAHGFFAFELERRGAARVVTAELPRWSAHDGSAELKRTFEEGGHDETHEPYLHDALAFAIEARGSRVEQVFSSVYDLSPDTVGTFDLVFCASMLLHVTDPLRALYAIRSVTERTAIVVTSVYSPRRLRRTGVPRARFVGRPAGQTFWEPDLNCLDAWVLAAGFSRSERIGTFRLTSVDGRFGDRQGVVHAHV